MTTGFYAHYHDGSAVLPMACSTLFSAVATLPPATRFAGLFLISQPLVKIVALKAQTNPRATFPASSWCNVWRCCAGCVACATSSGRRWSLAGFDLK